MSDDEAKWSSRKAVLTVFQSFILIVLPIVYQKLGISENVLLFVLGSTTALVGTYLGVNVWQKKVLNPESKSELP